MTLKFEERPPYEEIIDALRMEINKDVKLNDDLQPIPHHFEWAVNQGQKALNQYIGA